MQSKMQLVISKMLRQLVKNQLVKSQLVKSQLVKSINKVSTGQMTNWSKVNSSNDKLVQSTN